MNSFGLKAWIDLLESYEEHGLFADKDGAIVQMHRRFILNEHFWLQVIDRKVARGRPNRQDIELMMLGIEDGHYEGLANKLASLLTEEATRDSLLSSTFIISKIERIIEVFRGVYSVNMYPFLRKVYKTINNEAKVRESYCREISEAFDDFDVTYAEFQEWNQKRGYNTP